MSFFEELKRRNVMRVGIAYVVASWLLVQVGDIARESFEAPAWVMKMVITALIVAFPFVVGFAWAFELTPEGIKREKDVDRSQSTTGDTGRKLDTITIALLILVIGLIVMDRFVMPAPVATTPEGVVQSSNPTQESTATEAESAQDDFTSDSGSAITSGSIAVLPFVNMSNDPDQDFFSDGISEELLNLLVKVDGLDVASRTSSFAYKGSNNSIPDIARELKVANVLEGSVRKAGNQVRITAQLIDTTNDRHLWSETYDRDLTDIFQVQDDIATAIVSALRTELGLDLDSASVTVQPVTRNMNAYELYLQGREMVIARRDLYQAVEILEQAVELDPEFAGAWANLAAAHYLVPAWNAMPPPEQMKFIDQADQAADRALVLQQNQSLALAIKGGIRQFDQPFPNYEAGLEFFDRAIESDPNNATAWLWRGLRKAELGFQEAAKADLEQCLRLDPAYQNCLRHLGFTNVILGDEETARAQYVESVMMGFRSVDALFGTWLFAAGDDLAAVLAADHLRTRFEDFPHDIWVEALKYPQRNHLEHLPELTAWLDDNPRVTPAMKTYLLAVIGAYDQIVADPAFVSTWIWNPVFEPFRESPEFQRVIHDLGVTEYWEKHGLPPGCRKEGERYQCVVGDEARGMSQ